MRNVKTRVNWMVSKKCHGTAYENRRKGVNSGKKPNIDLWMGHKTKYYLVL